MKNKFLSLALAICMLVPYTFVLTACGDDPGHTHSWSSTYSHNATQHWRTCSDCEELDSKGSHTYNVDTCSVCGYVNSDLTPPALQSMSTYFSGYKAEYLKDRYEGTNDSKIDFTQLLNIQIEVLTQDILYRLFCVYGDMDITTDEIVLYESCDYPDEYTHLHNQAKVTFDTLLTDTLDNHMDSHKITDTLSTLDVTCAKCYQEALMAKYDTDLSSYNVFYNDQYMNLYGAIAGYNTELDGSQLVDHVVPGENSWINWTSSLDLTYETMLSTYKQTFRMAIAQILANETTVNGWYDSSKYEQMLSSIQYTGYFDIHKIKLIEYIYSHVIGNELVNHDNEIRACQYFDTNYNKVVYSQTDPINSFLVNAPYNNGSFTAEQIANSPRLYKGYSVVVPAIVEQALANTFEDTNITLYPKMSKTAIECMPADTQNNQNLVYRTVTLMPKADIVPTKLSFEVSLNSNAVGHTVSIDYDVVINGTVYSGTKDVAITTSAWIEVELDLGAITNGNAMGVYDGTTTSFTSGSAFSNEEFDASDNLLNDDGNNYIKLDFNNTTTDYDMVLKFNGMYNE